MLSRRFRLGGFLFAAALIVALVLSNAEVRAASRATIEVYPGTRAIKKGLKKAKPGDILNIHAGTYNEAVEIKKDNVTLRPAGDGTVIVDAQCSAPGAITIYAEGVTVRSLTVRGGSYYAIDIQHHASGIIRRNTLEDTCTADYGVNVFDGGAIKVVGNKASGYDDAGVYIGGIIATPNGTLAVKKNETFGNGRGIIVEDSDNVSIVVSSNKVHDNSTIGIFLHSSTGIQILKNQVTNNENQGIYLDGASTNNIVNDNVISGHTYDIQNDGANNCFNNNTYTTSQGPINAC